MNDCVICGKPIPATGHPEWILEGQVKPIVEPEICTSQHTIEQLMTWQQRIFRAGGYA